MEAPGHLPIADISLRAKRQSNAVKCVRYACALLTMLVLSGFQKPDRESDERQRLFEWFDTLGFDAIKTGQFVRVDWTAPNASKKTPAGKPDYGFLEPGGNAQRFVVLRPDLSHIRWSPDYAGASMYVVTYRPADLKSYLANEFRRPATEFRLPILLAYPQLFILARACAARGLEADSIALFAASKAQTDQPGLPFERALPNQISYFIFEQIVWDFRDQFLPRTDLISRLDTLLKQFPKSRYIDGAREAAADLRTGLEVDAKHVTPKLPLGMLPVKEKVAELIYRLKDQEGRRVVNPGPISVLRYGQKDGKSPAQQLLLLGFEAVPELLEASNDRRFTKAYPDGFDPGSGLPIRVKNAALEILSQIAHRDFAQWGQAGEYEAARQWWASVKSQGELKMLIEGVEKGNYDSPSQARRLVEAYPADAFEPIRGVLLRTTDDYVASRLISAVAGLPAPAVAEFIKEQMVTGIAAGGRLEAARQVSKVDPRGAIEAMAHEWRTIAEKATSDSSSNRELIDFLAGSGRDEAIAALAYRVDALPSARKVELMGCLAIKYRFRDLPNGFTTATKTSENYRRAVEDLIAGRLTDLTQNTNFTGSWNRYVFQNPRICDLATMHLAVIMPVKYRFKNPMSLSGRDRERIAALNVWRASRGLAKLPLPPGPTAATEPAATKKLLAAATSVDSDRRGEALQNLERLGPGCLPALLQAMSKQPPGQILSDMGALACRLSCVVRSVVILNPKSVPDQLVAKVESLRGKSLSTEIWVGLLREFVGPRSVTGSLTITALRDDDGLGVELTVDFGTPKGTSLGTPVSFTISGLLNGKYVSGEAGSDYLESFLRHGLADIRAAVEKCLSSDSRLPFSLRVSISR